METATLANLVVVGKGQRRKVPLEPAGAIIGRHPGCEVVLDSGRVSRRHARIFQDPFGRWVVEDLGSRNGVWIRDERVRIAAVGPGDKIAVGPFSLVVDEALRDEIEAEASTHTTTSLLVADSAAEVLTGRDRPGRSVPQARMKQLNDIIDRMGELTSPGELYPAVCERLTVTPGSVALVVRLPLATEPLPPSPKVIACRFGGVEGTERDTTNLHLSRRALEAVHSARGAIMASNAAVSEGQLGLTLVDAARPRAVFCAPVAEMADAVDVLYLDVPCDPSADETLDFIRVVARQVSAGRKSLLLAQARAQRTALDGQLELARRIQTGLTPAGLAQSPSIDVAVRYHPAMWVGGDYCDVWRLPDGRVALAVGDVSGKGLPAAMVMTNLQAALRATMSFCSQPGEVMGRLNDLLGQNLPEEMFVTFFLGLFDPPSGRLEYVNAGHLPPLMIGPPGSAGPLGRPSNLPLGIMDEVFDADAMTFAEGGGLVVFTDGITEAAAPDGSQLGTDGLLALLEGSALHSAEQLAERVVDAAVSFRQTLPQQDDITVLALIRRASSAARTILSPSP